MKKLTIRLDDALHEKLEALAKSERRTINNYVALLIERAAQQADKPAKHTSKQ